MYCGKCGAQITDSSIHCPSCGERVSGEVPAGQPSQVPPFSSQQPKADSSGIIAIAGSFLLILGAFLPWMGGAGGFVAIGTFMPIGNIGVAVLIVGVLSLPVTVMARSGSAGAWSVVMLILGALALALISQVLYFMRDPQNDFPTIGPGFWIAMAGALAFAAGSLLQLFGTSKR